MALPRETKMPSLLRRAILLACAAMMSGWGHPSRCCRCDAFSSALHPIPSPLSGRHSSPGRDVMITSSSSTTPRRRHRLRVSASERAGDVGDADDRSRPNIARIATHDEYLDFLRRDDRVCVIKYYADWCKSCQKFGAKFRHLAHDRGDLVDVDGNVVRRGDVRFAEVEYTASARLCKTLKVNKLPTVHMHVAGCGKVVDVTCKPSLFHLVVDELHRVMDGSASSSSSSSGVDADGVETDANVNMAEVRSDGGTTNSSFEIAMVDGSSLGEEIVASLRRGKEKTDGGLKKVVGK